MRTATFLVTTVTALIVTVCQGSSSSSSTSTTPPSIATDDNFEKMRQQLINGQGFLAALDQSGGSTPKALQAYQYPSDQYQANEPSMYNAVHDMRCRIMTSPVFGLETGVLGAILFEDTMHRLVENQPTSHYLWNTKQVIPFLKIDQGLLPPMAGVQLMKPIEESVPPPILGLDGLISLEERLATAKRFGVFGTKMRSVIHENNPKGIQVLVEQQFEYGKRVLQAGLVPILEPEINIQSPEKEQCEETLKECLLQALDQLQEECKDNDTNGGLSQVILKVSIPCKENFYQECIDHPACLKVVALSGGYTQQEANELLLKQPKMIASFSRALTEGLTHNLSDEEFDKILGASIASITKASI